VSAASATVLVDTSAPPPAPSLSYGSFTAASATGNTVYYRPSAASGSFTVTASAANDPESGLGNFSFPAAPTGWTRTLTGGTQATYSHTGSPTASATNRVFTVNGAGTAEPTGTSFAVTADSTAPTLAAPTVAGGYVTSLSVPVTVDPGSDGGSGVDAASAVLERDETTLSGGSCAAFPGTWTTVTLTGGADTTVQSGKCYRYRSKLSDKVGNQTASAASATVEVDAVAPTGSITAPGAGAYVGGASVAVTSDSADTGGSG